MITIINVKFQENDVNLNKLTHFYKKYIKDTRNRLYTVHFIKPTL